MVKYIAGEETERHTMLWEYDNLAAFEELGARYMDIFEHTTMKVKV